MGLAEGPGNAPESGRWTAYGANGEVAGTGLIGPAHTTTDLSGTNGKSKVRLEHQIDIDAQIQMIELEALLFGDGNGEFRNQGQVGTDSSDFNLMDVEFTPVTEFDGFL